MDTSINTKKENIIRPVDLVLGRKAKQEELTQADWERVISDLAPHVQPRLKYLSGMKPFFDTMNYSEKGGRADLHFYTRSDLLQSVEAAIGVNDFCVELCSLTCSSPSFGKVFPVMKSRADKFHIPDLHDHRILLTRKGDLIMLFCGYKLVKSGNYQRHYETKFIMAKKIRPEDLDLTFTHNMAGWSFNHTHLSDLSEGAVIVEGLYSLICTTIVDKEVHLEQLKDVQFEFDEKRNMIEGFQK